MYTEYRQRTQEGMGNSCSSNADTTSQTANNPKAATQQEETQFERPKLHHNCISGVYTRTEDDPKTRFSVDEEHMSWDKEFPEYDPIDFFAVQPVPIPEDPDYRQNPDNSVKWNENADVNRKSFQGTYEVVNNVPRNPVGRTGMTGRGTLARWGPNQAADPIVTRWRRDENGEVVKNESSGKNILQFISIQRGDCGMWAIPGGFVDTGEERNEALKREFLEESMNSEEATEEQRKDMENKCDKLFQNGVVVYRGYVDDPRNTDQAWMETTAVNFHDETGELVGELKLHAGDDAVGVKWQDLGGDLELYASHKDFIFNTAKRHDAHW